MPIVAKIGGTDSLRRELSNFREYIAKFDPRLQPHLHLHGGTGIIIFGFVDRPAQPDTPASTFRALLEKILNGELGSWGETLPKEDDLLTALDRSVSQLSKLNSHKLVTPGGGKSYAWMVGGLKAMSEQGVTWGIKQGMGDYCGMQILDVAQAALKTVMGLAGAATTHGDVHLNNILARDDRDPYLIDYAMSGPGHPCYDLLQLECAVSFQFFRMTADEGVVTRFMRAITITGAEYEDLSSQFPTLLTSAGNRLSTHLMIRVRKACMRLLAQYGGGSEDYLAMKLLISCHAMTMQDRQAGIVRATVRAIVGS